MIGRLVWTVPGWDIQDPFVGEISHNIFLPVGFSVVACMTSGLITSVIDVCSSLADASSSDECTMYV